MNPSFFWSQTMFPQKEGKFSSELLVIHGPGAKGVRQKEFGKKVTRKFDRSVRKSDRKVTKSVPTTKESDRTPFAALLLRHPESMAQALPL